MLVGLPGCGKSTYADKLSQDDYKVFSSDAIRIELLGNVQDNSKNALIFDTLHKRLTDALSDGQNCIYDATNVYKPGRIRFLESIKNIKCKKKCVVFDVDVATCKERNKSRDRQVPDEVYDKMLSYYIAPDKEEGWDEIEIVK